MKSFDDFISFLNESDFQERISSIRPPELISVDLTAESFPKLLEHMHTRAVADSLSVFLLCLEKYHEWLSQ